MWFLPWIFITTCLSPASLWPSMICLRHISHFYSRSGGQKISALKDINFTIPLGSFTAIIGPNSSGKSTLCRIMAGLLAPASGQVWLDDAELSSWEQGNLRKTIGLVFSHPEDQIVLPTVEEDLAFGLENFHFDRNQIEKKVADMIESLGMQAYGRGFTHQLSGGQKQKLAIASMLILGLRYLILDEPLSFLDTRARSETLAFIQGIHRQGTTIVYGAQFFEELTTANHIIALSEGKILWQGSFPELLKNPDIVSMSGIKVPPIIRLAERLRTSGLLLADPIYTVEQFITALRKVKNED
ncbi:MAG: ATP-binding cassette domain-containing protein [bacterium]